MNEHEKTKADPLEWLVGIVVLIAVMYLASISY
jgi:hypothetical protein